MSNKDWDPDLTPEQNYVLRQEGTESPGSSPLNDEKREGSTAYVSDEDHDKYYAAAFVGGKSETFLKMAKTISERVDEDERNGIIAKWHDESHLNKYFNENPPTQLSPSYMYPEELINNPQYPFKPKIVALKKESHFNQEKIEMGQYG